MSNAIDRALRIIESHPSVLAVSKPIVDSKTDGATVDVTFHIELPNAWMAAGRSPNGVLVNEVVTFVLPPNCSLIPPEIHLRRDFDRSLAHIQPGAPDKPPIPCIYDGRLAELLLRQGLNAILNQTALWLKNAAMGTLINPKQGWEPVRRDNVDDRIVADADYLRSLVKRDYGHAIFPFAYLKRNFKNNNTVLFGELGREPITLHPKTISERFTKNIGGHSIGIFVWPGKQPAGDPIIAGQYLPETVVDLGSLRTRAAEYGCSIPLRTTLERLQECVRSLNFREPLPIAIILCARRPYHLIGSDSELELCAYILDVSAPNLFPQGNHTNVRTAAQRHTITRKLLRRMSGTDPDSPTPQWVQLGCGSLGSKIALHLARAGFAPSLVIDNDWLSPHNAARHALLPISRAWASGLIPKADAVTTAIEGLGQSALATFDDVVVATRDFSLSKRSLPDTAFVVVNSTASLVVREALASVTTPITIPRVIETSLFSHGAVGLFSVEGPARNPDTGDLITEAYALIQRDAKLRELVFALTKT